MSEWFRTAFGEDYLALYAHRNAAEAAEAVDLILSTSKLPAGSLVLDAPCGAGRHLAAFQQRGMRAIGFDLSGPLLAEAVTAAGQRGSVVRADLRALPFKPVQCDMVVNLFSSLGYFATDVENYQILNSLVNLVRPGGWIVIDFMHSEYLRENLQPESQRMTDSGIEVRDKRWIGGSPERVNKETHLRHPDGSEHTLNESVRLFTPGNLRDALDASGIAIETEFGSYTGEAFDSESPRIILVGRRRS